MKHIYSLILTFISLVAFATNHNVSVTNSFTPSTLSINLGDTVTWTQASGTHNVNGNQSTFPGNPASFGSGSVAGGVWTYSYVFLLPGVYNYHCDPHSSFMTGSITVSSTPCSNLFFSEYSEGSSNNKYIEIYNPTANAVSLSTYTVYQSGNGGAFTNLFTTSASIASGDVYVISTNQANATILAEADTAMAFPSVAHFNGDDALILVNGTDTIDVIGVPGVDPGSSWTVGTGSTANHTLVRMASIGAGSTDWTTGATEWDVYAQNTWTYIGSHVINCITSPTACLPPVFASLTASDTSATISWSSVDTLFTVDYGIAGSSNVPTSVSVADTFVTVSGLSPYTTYEFSIETNCSAAGNGYSQTVGPYTVKTLCGALSTPVYENFDNSSTGGPTNPNAPSCWSYLEESGAGGYGYISNSNSWITPRSGSNFYTLNSSYDLAMEALVSPAINDLDNNGAYLEFYADATTSSGSLLGNTLYIGSLSDTTSLSSLDIFDTVFIPSMGGWKKYTIYFDASTGYNMIDDHIAIVSSNSSTHQVYVDDITIKGAPAAPCEELYFSEIGSGSQSNKYIELYNPSVNAISLVGYTLYGDVDQSATTYSFTSNATIASGDVYMIARSGANASILASADTALSYPSIAHFDVDDALVLVNGTDTIDVIGVPGVSPPGNSGWFQGTGSSHTSVRKNQVSRGSINWATGASEWDQYPYNTWDYAGSHSSDCIPIFYDVTFRVDMNNVSSSFTNVYASGTFNSWSTNSNQLLDADGDGIYEAVIPLLQGSYEYKFTYDNGVGQESLDSTLNNSCTITTGGSTARQITIPSANTILTLVCWEECISCADTNRSGPNFDIQLGSAIYSNNVTGVNQKLGSSVAISDDGKILVASAPGYQDWPRYGRVLLYNWRDGSSGKDWYYVRQFDESPYEVFGNSLSLSGDGKTLAISAAARPDYVNSPDTSYVNVYKSDSVNGTWTLISKINGEDGDDLFGSSVSLSYDGNVLAVGAINNDGNGSNSGHVRVYEYSTSGSQGYIQIGTDIDGEAAGDESGGSVSLSANGNVLAIGAAKNSGAVTGATRVGQVRVYEYTNNSWIQIGSDLDGEFSNDYFGSSVSLSEDGNIVAIGATGNTGNGYQSGHVRVYENSNSNWIQLGLDIDGEAAGDKSGVSVSLSNDGNILAIGSEENTGNASKSGHVRLYKYSNGIWSQGGDDIDGDNTNDRFGASVSLNGDGSTLAVGIPGYRVPSTVYYTGGQNVGRVEIYYDSFTPSFSNGGTGSFCAGDTIQVSVPDFPSRSYLWNTGDTTHSIDIYQSGNYNVIISTAGGLVDTIDIVANQLAAADTAITSSGSLDFCNGQSVTLTAAAGQNYLWNTGDTTQSIIASQAGSYFAVVTATNGCIGTTAALSTTLFPDPDINVTVTGSLSFCSYDSVTLSAAAGQSYVWSLYNTGATVDTTQSITVSQAGYYSALITDTNGCVQNTNYYLATVFNDADTTITINGALNFCSSDSVIMSVASGQNYLWNTGDTTQSITTNAAGSYYATVTTINGCIDTTAIYTTTLLPDPDTTITSSGALDFCSNGSVSLTAVAGQSYQWSNGDTSQSITITQAGSYYAEITNSFGCSDTTNTYVTAVFGDPDISVTTSGSLNLCSGETITLTAAAGQNYLWSTGATAQSITTGQAGTYFAIITTADGCVDTTTSYVVTVNPVPNLNIIAPQLELCSGQNVTLSTQTTYSSYLWGGDSTGTQDTLVVTPGTYWLSVTNSSGCVGTDTITITELAPYTSQPEVCILTNDPVTGFNQIIWERSSKKGVEYYNVYRDDVIGYTKVGSKGVNQLSQLTDNTANPGLQPYKYYITITDSCGIEHGSSISEHSTIHLQSSIGTSGEVNLLWTSYLGRTPLYYRISRKGVNDSVYTVIDSVNLTNNTYTDFNTLTGFTKYQISAVMGSGCNSSSKTGVTSSLSNETTQNTVSINEDVIGSIAISPNPNTGYFSITVDQNQIGSVYRIIDNLGRLIDKGIIKELSQDFDLSDKPKGIYIIQVSNEYMAETLSVVIQ